MAEPSDQTANWDQEALLRVRHRLELRGLQLELRADPEGWRWFITGREQFVQRRFHSLHLALEHADTYTAIWYGPDETPTTSGQASWPSVSPASGSSPGVLQLRQERRKWAEIVERNPITTISSRLSVGTRRVAGTFSLRRTIR